MALIKINYTQSGQSKFVEFDTDTPLPEVLDQIGRIAATGGLYILNNREGVLTIAIAGRCIETVEVVG